MAPTPRRGAGGRSDGVGGLVGNRAAVKSWAQIAVALCVVALPWCISHASGGVGKAAMDRLSRDGYSFGAGGVALKLSANPSGGGRGGSAGAGGAKGPPLRGGGAGGAGGGGGGGGGAGRGGGGGGGGEAAGGMSNGAEGGSSADASSQSSSSSSMFSALGGIGGSKAKVWKGARLNFDGPDNVDIENQIQFLPPPPPDSPKHQLSYAQMTRSLDRIKQTETDPFERGLAVDAFKTKWAGFLPKPGHLPVHIPLPKDMTVEEVEEIQARLNLEASTKGRQHGIDPAFNVMERMRRKQAAEAAAAATESSKAGGPHKTVVQLALERLSFSAKDALTVFEEEQKSAASAAGGGGDGGGGGGGHGKPAVADKAMQDKLAAAAAGANPRITLPRKPVFRTASLRQRAEEIASDEDEDDSDAVAEATSKLFYAHGRERKNTAAARGGGGGGGGRAGS